VATAEKGRKRGEVGSLCPAGRRRAGDSDVVLAPIPAGPNEITMNTPTLTQLIIVALGFGVVAFYVFVCSRFIRASEKA
jgi:hypothetical protein